MALTGKRAMVADLKREREAKIIAYPSDGEGDYAIVHFDGDSDPVTVHKSRVHKIIPDKAIHADVSVEALLGNYGKRGKA
jgi:hypothetical protein